MGDVSIMARRLKDGTVEYGWSGNCGYYSSTGTRLLAWYDDPDKVDYLFGLGQTSLIGKPGSEKGGCGILYTHRLDNTPCWLGKSEQEIFSKIAFIDYGYFYDTDNRWYYIAPGPFSVKFPLSMIAANTDESGNEFSYLKLVEKIICKYMLTDYKNDNTEFSKLIDANNYDAEKLIEFFENSDSPLYDLYREYKPIYEYFDDWIVIKFNGECETGKNIVLKKKSENHVETCYW